MKNPKILLSLILIVGFSCTLKNQNKPEKQVGSGAEPSEFSFSIPEIPAMIASSGQQAVYLADHYWDNFDFNLIPGPEFKQVIEKAFVDYLIILAEVEPGGAARSVSSLMGRASENEKLSLYFAEKAEMYLHHPNSPIRNEVLYEEFLKGILSSEAVEPVNKIRYQNHYDLALKNKPGSRATDFNYTLKDGSQSTLFKTEGKLIMLYFHNPDCHECAATRERIMNSGAIQSLQDQGVLTILAVYPDEDLDLWNRHYAEFPDNWINAYDQGTIIENEELYDLKAIPTIYLLDEDKKVILRDPTFDQLEAYLSSL